LVAGSSDLQTLREWSVRYFLFPIQKFLEDDTVSEVMINGPNDVRIERRGVIEKTDVRFASDQDLVAAVINIAQLVGKRITPEVCRLDARLPDGSRVHAVLPPVSRQGPCLAIRKFFRSKIGLDRLVELGALTSEVREFIDLCVLTERNMVVAGGTGCGKTTLLNVLAALIPPHERVIVLEDTSELQLQLDHVLYLEARPPDRHGKGEVTLREMFHSCLRMRPDRIVVGECRGGEAVELIQSMTSGHGGSMTTLHASSPFDALNRLETMALMAGLDLPLSALRSQISSAIQVVVHLERLAGGSRKVLSVAEIRGLDEAGRYVVVPIYEYVPEPGGGGGELARTGNRSGLAKMIALKGLERRIHLTRGLFAPIEGGRGAGHGH
jgi:pilus assembly protein CpaF